MNMCATNTGDRCCSPKCRHVERISLVQKCILKPSIQVEADSSRSVQKEVIQRGIVSKTEQGTSKIKQGNNEE